MIRGKHNMKIGMDYRDNQTDQFSAPTNGRFQFARTETSHPAFPGQTGFDFGSYLLGDVDRAGLLDPAFTNDLPKPGVQFSDCFSRMTSRSPHPHYEPGFEMGCVLPDDGGE